MVYLELIINIHFIIFIFQNIIYLNKNCDFEEISKRLIEKVYLALIYIDYSINHLNKNDMKTLLIKRDRFPISLSVYKRIWLYLKI